jgi:hypothetical protein
MKRQTLVKKEYFGKKVQVVFIDGQESFIGVLTGYTSELDNEPDGESITVDTTRGPFEIFTEEVKEISLI